MNKVKLMKFTGNKNETLTKIREAIKRSYKFTTPLHEILTGTRVLYNK